MAVNDHEHMSCVKRAVRAPRRRKRAQRDSHRRAKALQIVGAGRGADISAGSRGALMKNAMFAPIEEDKIEQCKAQTSETDLGVSPEFNTVESDRGPTSVGSSKKGFTGSQKRGLFTEQTAIIRAALRS